VSTIFKPAGLPVFPPHVDPGGDCVLAELLARDPWRSEIDWPNGFAGGIAHRLDVGTSGALFVADSLEELRAVREAFASGKLRKRYLMRTAKRARWRENRCERPIAHAKRRKGRMVVQRGPNTPHRGKWYPASSAFRVLGGDLLAVEITTGVMHQIRVHAAFLGVPLLGDRRYGGGEHPEGFFLHHVGFEGGGFATEPVPEPAWAMR